MAARKLLTIAGMILTTLLIMSWVGYPSTLYNSPSTDAAEVGDRPHSLRIAKINVQGQKDLSGRVLVDLGQSAEEAYDPAGVEGNVEGAKL
jgi:hypothetical protein